MKQVQIVITVEVDECDDASALLPITYVEFAEGESLRCWADLTTDVGVAVPGEDGPGNPPLARIVSSETAKSHTDKLNAWWSKHHNAKVRDVCVVCGGDRSKYPRIDRCPGSHTHA